MCWKHEWAKAINNLNRAERQIAYGRDRLEKRLLRNEKNLRSKQQSKKHNYPCELKPVQARINRNKAGISTCNDLIDMLKAMQDRLFVMVHAHGISKGNSQRVYRLMGKYDLKKACEMFNFLGLVFDGESVHVDRRKS